MRKYPRWMKALDVVSVVGAFSIVVGVLVYRQYDDHAKRQQHMERLKEIARGECETRRDNPFVRDNPFCN